MVFVCLFFIALVVCTLIISSRIPILQYYVKYLIFITVIILGSLYYMVRLGLVGRSYSNAWRFKKTFALAGRLIGLHPVVQNLELLSPDTPCIYVANHQSCIDVVSLVDVWPKKCTVVSKSSLMLAGPVGVIMWLTKCICINRSDHKNAIFILKNASENIKKDKVSVCIFPEGTRTDCGTLLPFKKGAFHLAVECQFPIQPIVIEPYTKFLDHKKKWFKSATYAVKVLPRIETAGMDASKVDYLLNKTRTQMLEEFESLKKLA